MKSFSDLLREAIEESGMTLEQIVEGCKKRGLDIHATYISKLRLGKRLAPPDDQTIRILAEVIGADPHRLVFQGYLDRAPDVVREVLGVLDEKIVSAAIAVHNGHMTRQEFESSVGAILREHIQTTHNASNDVRKYIKERLDGSDAEEESEQLEVVKLYIEGTISTTPVERLRRDFEGYDYVAKSVLAGRNGFVLKIQGDGMASHNIYDGDRVVIATADEYGSNDIVYVRMDDSPIALAKVKKQNNMCVVIPLNANMEIVLTTPDRVNVIGKVVEVRRSFK
jgi:SOS-response transcriptional repressor LexA